LYIIFKKLICHRYLWTDFQAPNLPALVLKIMRGTVEPLPLRYSSGLRQLISSMLALNPVDRPDLVNKTLFLNIAGTIAG
jgi:hypothetical protein